MDEFEKYGEEGYWPYSHRDITPQRLLIGTLAITQMKAKIMSRFGNVPPHALEVILNNPAFAGDSKFDIIDSMFDLEEENGNATSSKNRK